MRPESLLLVLLAVSAPLAAAPPAETQKKDAREAEPSLDLLEFLGSWETATGTWNETIPDSDDAAPSPARRPKEKARD
ncbi:MAG: hypothetical protein EPN55_01405 [Gammaproteobacteria bacterium]|nr:MAG: hypothetical protein EPN55_01405 [Gammaproteobacteria bacterium]